MESMERISAPPQLELGASNGHKGRLETMSEFLARPRAARDFQDLKADAQRLQATVQARERLNTTAAEAELEPGRQARISDEHRNHKLSFGFGVLLATLFV